jgi:hypothetical protein
VHLTRFTKRHQEHKDLSFCPQHSLFYALHPVPESRGALTSLQGPTWPHITETNRIQLVLSVIQIGHWLSIWQSCIGSSCQRLLRGGPHGPSWIGIIALPARCESLSKTAAKGRALAKAPRKPPVLPVFQGLAKHPGKGFSHQLQKRRRRRRWRRLRPRPMLQLQLHAKKRIQHVCHSIADAAH